MGKDLSKMTLEQSGFTVMYAEPNRISLNKGYTEDGFHLQMDGRSTKGIWRPILTYLIVRRKK